MRFKNISDFPKVVQVDKPGSEVTGSFIVMYDHEESINHDSVNDILCIW